MGNTSTWIAVIDDDEGIRRALLRLLRSAGMEAHAFSSGKKFLTSRCLNRPACILIDLQMPEISGFEVIEKLQVFDPELPVIVLTGQDVSEEQKKDRLGRVLRILHKPVHDIELFNTISLALNTKPTDSQTIYKDR
ncbi:response regulator [Undibacterium sp. Xuan67W]|uniref:response regulator n=1 Tax=Undibacterium sp. Xuan67W TaxID=3413057 RepID=UPI003BF3ACCF